MTKTTILLVVYIALILKNIYLKILFNSLWWAETLLDWLFVIVTSAIGPTILCGLILYFF